MSYMNKAFGAGELRQKLSQHLRRVEEGETLEVLLASGRVTSARLEFSSLPPPAEPPSGISISQALADLRSEER